MWQELFNETLKDAEYLYDRVVRRWGNPYFAQSTLYDWIWSEAFSERCQHLSPKQQGALRVALMDHFRVKPWPWHHSEKGQKHRGIL